MTLKMGSEVTESGTIRQIVYGILLVFFSDFFPKMHSFWDNRLQECRDLENHVRGPSRSLETSPFDTHTVFEIWLPIDVL